MVTPVSRFEHLVPYQSEDCETQIDYILYTRRLRKKVANVQVIVGEECVAQHRLVVVDLKVLTHSHLKRTFVPRTMILKLRDLANLILFSTVFKTLIQENKTSEET